MNSAATPLRVLVFCGDRFHSPETVSAGLLPLEKLGFAVFEWVEDASEWNPAALAGVDVVLFSKSNVYSHTDHRIWMGDATANHFREFVREGGGLVAVHSGTASYQGIDPIRSMLGGVFVSHPPACEVVLLAKAGHAITAGLNERPFAVHDEHYIIAISDERLDVFLEARSSIGTRPAGWTRREGKGRVCVLTPGHFPEVWLHPSFQQMLKNGILWSAQGE